MKSLILTIAIVVGGLCMFGHAVAPLLAADPQAPSDLQPVASQNASTSIEVQHTRRVVLDEVGGNGSVIAYDTFTENAATRRAQFPQAIFTDQPADHRFILFESLKFLQQMNPAVRGTLIDELNAGKWIIGLDGTDAQLKLALGLLPPQLQTVASGLVPASGLAVFLYRNRAGVLNELILPAPDTTNIESEYPGDQDSLSAEMDDLTDWYSRVETITPNSSDPWNAIQNFEWDGPTTGEFRGNEQTVGSYRFTLSPYWLDSDQNGRDWYRVDFQTYSFISNYKYKGHKFGDTGGKCGWWTNKEHADITVTTPGGSWWEFMPNTTVGSTTTSFSIGGMLTTSQTGVTGAYSKSYGTPDVKITVSGSSIDHSIEWKAGLQGCGNYSSYPYYDGASSAAKSSYNLAPSLIMYVPAGEPLKFKTSVDNGNSNWDFEVEKDRIKCKDLCTSIKVNQFTATYWQNKKIACTKTACVFY